LTIYSYKTDCPWPDWHKSFLFGWQRLVILLVIAPGGGKAIKTNAGGTFAAVQTHDFAV